MMHEELKPVIEGRYAALRRAMDSRDAAALKAVLATDFSSIDVDGQSTGDEQMIAALSKLPSATNAVRKTTIEQIAGSSNDVLVVQKYERSTTQADAAGIAHQTMLVAISADHWVKIDSKWMIRQTRTKDISVSRDGAVVVHKVAAPEPQQ